MLNVRVFKNCKAKPLNGYNIQQVAVIWQLKTFRGNVPYRAGTTIGLLSLAYEIL